MQATEIDQAIRMFLTDNFLLGRSEPLQDDALLLGNVIDSTGVIEMVVFIQEHFTITVEDDEVTTDNLGSVRNAVAYVERKLRGKAS
jgi:acyl carrier protein